MQLCGTAKIVYLAMEALGGSAWGHPQTKSHLAQFDTVCFGPSGLISFLFFGYWFYNLLELVLSMMHELRCRKSLPECGLEAVQ